MPVPISSLTEGEPPVPGSGTVPTPPPPPPGIHPDNFMGAGGAALAGSQPGGKIVPPTPVGGVTAGGAGAAAAGSATRINPALLGVMLGAGAGALHGAVNPGKKRRLAAMLQDAGLGAGVGGLGGLAYNNFGGMPAKTANDIDPDLPTKAQDLQRHLQATGRVRSPALPAMAATNAGDPRYKNMGFIPSAPQLSVPREVLSTLKPEELKAWKNTKAQQSQMQATGTLRSPALPAMQNTNAGASKFRQPFAPQVLQTGFGKAGLDMTPRVSYSPYDRTDLKAPAPRSSSLRPIGKTNAGNPANRGMQPRRSLEETEVTGPMQPRFRRNIASVGSLFEGDAEGLAAYQEQLRDAARNLLTNATSKAREFAASPEEILKAQFSRIQSAAQNSAIRSPRIAPLMSSGLGTTESMLPSSLGLQHLWRSEDGKPYDASAFEDPFKLPSYRDALPKADAAPAADKPAPNMAGAGGQSPNAMLLGALLGAGGGAMTGALAGGKKNRLRRALAAAGIGAGLGAGVGHQLGKKAAEEESSADSESSELSVPQEKKVPSRSKDIVDMDSNRGRLADYLFSGHIGGERAGRAQAMAAATGEGEKAPFDVRHPMTGATLRALPLSAIGALLGGLGGGALYGSDTDPTGVVAGGLAGGVAGTGLGAYLAGKSRRDSMREIGDKYDAALAEGQVTPRKPQFSGLAAALAPLRGPHRTGQLEGYRAVGGTPIDEQRPRGRNLLYAAQHLPITAPVPALSVLQGYGQNLRTQFA